MNSRVESAVADVSDNIPWLILAGVIGTFSWELTTDVVTPLLFGSRPEPAALVRALLGLPGEYRWLAELIHYLVGVLAYPLGYVAVVRQVLPLPAIVRGAVYGVALWVLALGIMAPIAGNPPFLGWGSITWASLLGHVVLGIAIALVFDRGIDRD